MEQAYDGTIRGIILDTGHGTLRDGPGWRSIVYFKGCNFKCAWCGSPETWNRTPEVLFFDDRVKYLERLAATCARGAMRIQNGGLQMDRARCDACEAFSCALCCADGSAEIAGRETTVQDIIHDILPFRRAHSEYGVTLSGGEATLQWDFYMELLKACRAHRLHTAVETNGSSPRLPESFPLLGLVMCDLKHIDSAEHRRWTGHGNEQVLENIRAAAHAPHTDLRVRIPLVPEVNGGPVLDRMIEFLLPLKDLLEVEILGFHRMGAYKWKALGRTYQFNHTQEAPQSDIEQAILKMTRAGLCVVRS